MHLSRPVLIVAIMVGTARISTKISAFIGPASNPIYFFGQAILEATGMAS